MWAIIDDNGIIHTGTSEEMETAYVHMINGLQELEIIYSDTNVNVIEQTMKHWEYDWEGDLMLIEIHRIAR